MTTEMAAKKAVFEILGHVDPLVVGPRLGCFSINGRKDMKTPNFIAIGSRGVIPHMTPDVIMAHSEIGGVHMALEDFVEKGQGDVIAPIMKCPGNALHTFTALPQSVLTLLAPRRNPAVTSPHGNTNSSVFLFTSNGFQPLTNQKYISTIEKLRPDISIALADVAYGTQPGAKRIKKMGDRTQEWVAELLSANVEKNTIFAPVLPIDSQSQSDYLLYLDEEAEGLSGLAFYDSSLLPDIPATTALSALPHLSLDEPASPHHILRQIESGMDIFAIPFINFATDAGIALSFVFPQPPSNIHQNGNEEMATAGHSVSPLGLDMWTSDHATLVRPIVQSCSCYACTSHHRAYIQHLLSAKEMLGWVLIQTHNHAILSQFFDSIRQSIANGTFEEDVKTFTRYYESELPAKSGQGPRQRGYHNKSRANQRPINHKAWKADFGSRPANEDVVLPVEV